jgi:hypothetical protein
MQKLTFVYEDDIKIKISILRLYSYFISINWNHQQTFPVSRDYPFKGGL